MQSLVICTQYKYFSLSTFQSTGDEMAARSNIRYTFVIWLKAVQSFSDIFLHSNYPKKSSTSNRDSQQFTWWFFFSHCCLTPATERHGCEPRAIRYVCQQRWPGGELLDTPCVKGEEKGKAERKMENSGCGLLSESAGLLSDKSNANWQSALWLQIHWLPPLHRWSLSHACTRTHATTHSATLNAQTHCSATSMDDCSLH